MGSQPEHSGGRRIHRSGISPRANASWFANFASQAESACATFHLRMSANVRVRFAPSPTGYLHVGGARTALFNWLYARHTGGRFVLRIEDTDQARNTAAALQVIYDGLHWLGLDWDEGPQVGGDFGPYFQSERDSIYAQHFDRLRDRGDVYEDGGAWRFRFRRQSVAVDDMICGRVTFDFTDAATMPDMTIRRPDGSWIFHFVNVVDDIEMKITHVIRGEDHLSNTPKHLQLFAALGAAPPRYAHIPLILNKDGSKMSKRDQGASVASYVEQRYVPAAIRNYLCLLGWSPKDDREKMSIEEVVPLFDPAHINRKAAQFDLEKCNWLNAQYLAAMSLDEFVDFVLPEIDAAGVRYGSRAALVPVVALIKEKIKRAGEVPQWIDYFFDDDYPFDPAAVEKTLRKPGACTGLQTLRDAFQTLAAWDATTLEMKLKETAAVRSCKPAELIHPARVAASGRTIGPSLYHMLEVLGKARVLARFERALHLFCR
jgi:glutamyl-tRNA synthetase